MKKVSIAHIVGGAVVANEAVFRDLEPRPVGDQLIGRDEQAAALVPPRDELEH